MKTNMENSKMIYAQRRDFGLGSEPITKFLKVRVEDITENYELSTKRYLRKYENSTPEPLNSPIKFISVGETSTIKLDWMSSIKTTTPPTVYKSTDAKNWELWDYSTITLNDGDFIYLKGDNKDGWCPEEQQMDRYIFYIDGKVNVEGNIMSLLGDDVIDIPCDCCFMYLFNECEGLYDCSKLELPSQTLTYYCYDDMFCDCINMIKTPEILPAKTLAESAYCCMFCGCKNITKTPLILAETTNSTEDCCDYMFGGCTSLTDCCDLLIKNLTSWVYNSMFDECTSLIHAPKILAENIDEGALDYMFKGCSSLIDVTLICNDFGEKEIAKDMFEDITTTGSLFVKTELKTNEYLLSIIPETWEIKAIEE